MMLAIADLKYSKLQPTCEVWVVFAVDEEHAFRGVLKLLEDLEAVAAVVSEPTAMKMAIASKGCSRWRIIARGKAVHSSKPRLGTNVMEHMAQVVALLERASTHLA